MVDIDLLNEKVEEGVCVSQFNICFRMPKFRILQHENKQYFYIKT